MTTDSFLLDFLAKHSADKTLSHSEAYQTLLEELDERLLPGLLSLLGSPTPGTRAAAINLLATRLPHEQRVVGAVAPLIRDPDGYVMLTATDRLAEFPRAMVEPFLADAYQMVLDHLDSEDEVPSIAAMRLCLRVDFEAFKEALLPRLLAMHDVYEGFEGHLLSLTLHDLGLIEE